MRTPAYARSAAQRTWEELGAEMPTKSRLDAAIDAAMAQVEERSQWPIVTFLLGLCALVGWIVWLVIA